jgi:hypothetical protein
MSKTTSTSGTEDQVSHGPLFDALLAYQKTAAMRAAIELDVFSAIAEGHDEAETLAARIGANARGVRIICDFLAVEGFLSKSDGRYALSPVARTFLVRSSPAYAGVVSDFLCAPAMQSLMFNDPVAYVRNGGSLGLANIAPENPIWLTFAEAMVPFVSASAESLTREIAEWPTPPRHVLDIAAGHGLFGISIAKAVPEARVTALDWAAVLALAERNARAAGVSNRYRTIPGDAFEVDFDSGYDLILLPNFLHHFDRATCITLMRKVRAALSPEGQAIAVEFVADEDRLTPPQTASFALVMLATTPAGDALTRSDFALIADGAGFRSVSVAPLAHSPASRVTFGR